MCSDRPFRHRDWREDAGQVERRHSPPGSMKICICVRKRPINSKEIKKRDHDSVSCLNPAVHVHACKLKVDGITKYLDNQSFQFDHTFGEDDTTDDVYMYTAQPLVDYILRGGRATIFACTSHLFACRFFCFCLLTIFQFVNNPLWAPLDGQTGSG